MKNNMVKKLIPVVGLIIGWGVFSISQKVYANYIVAKTSISLDERDKKNLDNSMQQLFAGAPSAICGIIHNKNMDKYNTNIKKYCANYGVKITKFINNEDINAVVLKR